MIEIRSSSVFGKILAGADNFISTTVPFSSIFLDALLFLLFFRNSISIQSPVDLFLLLIELQSRQNLVLKTVEFLQKKFMITLRVLATNILSILARFFQAPTPATCSLTDFFWISPIISAIAVLFSSSSFSTTGTCSSRIRMHPRFLPIQKLTVNEFIDHLGVAPFTDAFFYQSHPENNF